MPVTTPEHTRIDVPIARVEASAYTIPTDGPESDGTLEWEETTLVLAQVTAGDVTGLGYSYTDASAVRVIRGALEKHLVHHNALDIEARYAAMVASVRNLTRPGIASAAISAVDVALWDLKARLLGLPLISLLSAAREAVPLYGSGGFTSYSIERLQEQLGGWAREGFGAVKMKVGRDPAADRERVRAARRAIGAHAALFVDANGAYGRKQALQQAEIFAEQQVAWFEEPVTSDDLEGLRLVRDRAPAGMDVAAGEYGHTPDYFRRMLAAGSVDVIQADATRCGGITGFLRAAALADAWHVPISAHTAPSVHAHPCCAAPRLLNLEYFHDHVRIEHLLFDGVLRPEHGTLRPDRSRPGLGLAFRRADADRYLVRM
ncbi:MAG TPA: enolase C-terminal domain-like protein [Vicinamibacterales bacterium]|jgi:L-alanine-DL-glutamate epimerase-like enolase superfamily enzyme